MNTYIGISGNICTGKTSMLEFIKKTYPIKPCYENDKFNPYLKQFYQNMNLYAFHSQIFYLIQKLNIYSKNTNKIIVIDRTIYEDAEIFATNLFKYKYISKKEFAIYWNLYQNIIQLISKPAKLLYLKCSIETIKNRIKKRSIKNHINISSSYLNDLQILYSNWINTFDKNAVITINTDKLNYLNINQDREKLKKQLAKLFV